MEKRPTRAYKEPINNFLNKEIIFKKEPLLGSFMTSAEDVWRWFGFEKNPYDFHPLGVNKEDRELFVGRDVELPRLATPIVSEDGGIVVVEGRVGVGKTSFVNAVQYDKWQEKVCLPSFQVFQTQRSTDPIGFILSAFSTCLGSFEQVNPGVVDKNKTLAAGKAMVSQMLNVGWSFSAGGSLGVFGAQAGAGKTAAPSSPLLPALPQILRTSEKWFQEAKKLGAPKFVVQVNNLDMLDDDTAVEFLNVTRDYMLSFARMGVWWILVAKDQFMSVLESRAHRVSEVITGPPVRVGPLSLGEVNQAIGVRQKRYAAGSGEGPVANEVIHWLYEQSGGEVRAVFNKLTELVYGYHATVPSAKDIPVKVAKSILIDEARRKIEDLDIQDNHLNVLRKSVTSGGLRLSEYNAYGFKSEPALNYAVQKLCTLNLLRRTERGKGVMYIPAVDANLAFPRAE